MTQKIDFRLKTFEMMLLMVNRFISLSQTEGGPSNPRSYWVPLVAG